MSRSALQTIAVAVALLFALILGSQHSGIISDSATYLDQVKHINAGQGPVHGFAYWDPVYERQELPTETSLWPTGYPRLLGVFTQFGLSTEAVARAISLAATLGTAWLFFQLACFVMSSGRAFLAALATVVFVPFLAKSTSIATEQLYFFLTTTVWYCLVRASQSNDGGGLAWWAIASIVAALSFSIRYVGLASVCAVFIWLIVATYVHQGAIRLPKVNHLLAVLLPPIVLVAPVMWSNYASMGTIGQPWPGADIFWSTLPQSAQATASVLMGSKALLSQWGLAWIGFGFLLSFALFAAMSALFVLLEGHWRRIFQQDEFLNTLLPGGLVIGGYIGITLTACFMNGMNVETRYIEPMLVWFLFTFMLFVLRADVRWSKPLVVIVGLFTAGQAVAALNWAFADKEPHYSDRSKDAATIEWIRSSVPSDQVILVTRGGEVSRWVDHRILRVPRIPHSAHSLSWSSIDTLADQFGAKYLVHWLGAGPAKFDNDQYQFFETLNQPDQLGRKSHQHDELFVVYEVGASQR